MCALGKCYGVVEACKTTFSHHMTPLSLSISADNAKTTALHHKEWLSWQNKHPMSFICQPQRGNKNVQLECSCSNNQQMTIMPTWCEKQTTKDQETQLSPHLAHQSTSLKPKLRHMPRKLFHLKLHNKLLSPSHSLSLKPKIVAPKAFSVEFSQQAAFSVKSSPQSVVTVADIFWQQQQCHCWTFLHAKCFCKLLFDLLSFLAHIAKVIICHVNARPPVVGVTSYEAQSCFYSSGKSSPSHTFVTLVCSPSFLLFLSLFHQEQWQNTIIFSPYHPRHSWICLFSTSAELLYNHQVKMSHFVLSSVSDRF